MKIPHKKLEKSTIIERPEFENTHTHRHRTEFKYSCFRTLCNNCTAILKIHTSVPLGKLIVFNGRRNKLRRA